MSNRLRIKICGITNIEDALLAAEYGADALGFILVRESPRFIESSRAAEIIEQLPPFINSVGVCTDISQIVDMTRFDTLQIYSAAPRSITQRTRVMRAFRVADETMLDEIERTIQDESPDSILLDAYSPLAAGGNGISFDWEIAAAAVRRFALPLTLAGGLNVANIREAVRRVSPWAVDVSSGVESYPGKKDPDKLRAFIDAASE